MQNMDDITPWEDPEKPKPHRLQAFLDFFDPDNKKTELTANQNEKLELMRQTRYWRQNMFSPNQVVKMLMEKNEFSQSQAYQILKDADFIFGKIDLLNKDAERSVQYELLHKAAQMVMACKESKQFDKGLALERIVGKMSDLSGTKDMSVNFDPIKAMAPVQITFEIMQAPEPKKVVDTDYEIEP